MINVLEVLFGLEGGVRSCDSCEDEKVAFIERWL
jgi:hypothetical protein